MDDAEKGAIVGGMCRRRRQAGQQAEGQPGGGRPSGNTRERDTKHLRVSFEAKQPARGQPELECMGGVRT